MSTYSTPGGCKGNEEDEGKGLVANRLGGGGSNCKHREGKVWDCISKSKGDSRGLDRTLKLSQPVSEDKRWGVVDARCCLDVVKHFAQGQFQCTHGIRVVCAGSSTRIVRKLQRNIARL